MYVQNLTCIVLNMQGAPENTTPGILRGVRPGSEVRFSYTFADGEAAQVTGHAVTTCGKDGTVTGLKVRLDQAYMLRQHAAVAKAIEADTDRPVVVFALTRITPSADTGLIVPVSRKEITAGTGTARLADPSENQVRYALSLCGRTTELGGGNFWQLSADEFRAMTRDQISKWITTARDELGLQGEPS